MLALNAVGFNVTHTCTVVKMSLEHFKKLLQAIYFGSARENARILFGMYKSFFNITIVRLDTLALGLISRENLKIFLMHTYFPVKPPHYDFK